jgi:hypothetical protein
MNHEIYELQVTAISFELWATSFKLRDIRYEVLYELRYTRYKIAPATADDITVRNIISCRGRYFTSHISRLDCNRII